MENYNKFIETIEMFKEDFGKIKTAKSTSELNAIEARCVNELQLAVVEIEMVGRDLKSAVVKRDGELRA